MLQEYIDQAQPTSERRKYPRVRLITKVHTVALGRKDTLVTRDVSVGGLVIATKNPYPANSEIEVTFSLPSGPLISCRGEVSYAIKGCCMGVRFLEMSEESRCALMRFVTEPD